jgi:tetratricopeptide (TPR) repeat protein
MMPEMTDRAEVDRLIAAGHLAEAGALLEQGGELDEALRLYEKLWDFVGAARVAERQGDLARALTNILRGRDPAALDALISGLADADVESLEACAEICEQRNMLPLAAELRERLGHAELAAALYERASLKLEAARLHEAAGQHRRALALYRAHLGEVQGAAAATAELALGRLLLRFGRPAEAVATLQAAARHDPELGRPAGQAAAVALHRAGFSHAARTSLTLLAEQLDADGAGDRDGDPTELTLEHCLADESLSALERDQADHTVLAGRYRLGELLGSGGMGRVYAAADLLSGDRVAVKVFTAPGGARGRDAYKRFVREASTTGRLDHPHIVRLRDFNEEMGFIVLEYMDGGTLADRLRPRLGVAACRSVALQVLDGLAAAHQRGIVHRDLKPSNVFFTAVGAAKLGDFGVAHLSDAGQTQTGAFIGTLAYMSPEQILGAEVSFATDIYALGVMLHMMLTGHLPFEPPAVIDQHLNSEPPPPSARVDDLPPICDQVVLRCLAKQPERRYESLSKLRADLLRFPTTRDGDVQPRARDEAPSTSRREADSRFTVEALRFVDAALELTEARDDELGRSVLLARIAPGPLREPLIALLRAAASADAHLSTVLDLGPGDGNATLELPLGEPATLPWEEPLDLCEQLVAALAPLHAQGLAHGAIRAGALTQRGRYVQLSLVDALVERVRRQQREQPMPTLAEDLMAVAALSALALPPVSSAAELQTWLRAERQRRSEVFRRSQLEEALRGAPPEVDRAIDAPEG